MAVQMREQALEQLRRLCADYGISDEVEATLIRQAGFIATWRDQIRPNELTSAQRVKKLQRIQSLALELQQEIETLPFLDRWALDAGLSTLDFAGVEMPLMRRSVEDRISYVQKDIKTGAPPLTDRQADFIRCIAQVLKPTNIAPANSGRFAELCRAVFELGGLTFPDRALRHFMKNMRPQLKTEGFCN